MTVYLILGILGLGILLLSFVLDGAFESFEIDVAGGIFSITAIAALLAAFGFTGVIAVEGFGLSAGMAAPIAVVAGVGADVLAAWFMRTVRNKLDADIEREPLLGASGVIVTPIVEGGKWGEVSIRLDGLPIKMSAVSNKPLDLGLAVRVDEVLSSTAVRVVLLSAPDMRKNRSGLPPARLKIRNRFSLQFLKY